MTEDSRSKQFVFIPFCLICQAFQAKGIVKHGWHGVITPIIKELINYDINIIQLPCPESEFGGLQNGLKREPKGINGYDTTEFRQLCTDLSQKTLDTINAIIHNGYEIKAIFGIEYSPSCSVKYQYTNKGTIHRPGIFMEILMAKLKKEKVKIPFIGINRKSTKRALKDIYKLFEKRS